MSPEHLVSDEVSVSDLTEESEAFSFDKRQLAAKALGGEPRHLCPSCSSSSSGFCCPPRKPAVWVTRTKTKKVVKVVGCLPRLQGAA